MKRNLLTSLFLIFYLQFYYAPAYSQVTTIYGDDIVWGDRTAPCNLIINGSFENTVASTVNCSNTGGRYLIPNRDRQNLYTLPGWTLTGHSTTVSGQVYSYSYPGSMPSALGMDTAGWY